MPPQHVALLRGINVGGKNIVPMKELRGLLEELGAEDVRTYIQSGNVVFRGSAKLAKALEVELPRAIAERFGVETPVVLRSEAQFQAALENTPFSGEEDSVHVAFLSRKPNQKRVAGLDPERSPGDRFEVVGSEIYLHLPNGVRKTKLTNAWFDAQLGVISTVRNRRTMTKISAMLD